MDNLVLAFFNKYLGLGINFDQAYGNQCMDLAEQYNKEVVGAPRIGGNAINAWTNYPTAFYQKIVNSPTDPNSFPRLGDLIIFNYGQYGHIDICKSADFYSIIGFDQNWPLQGYTDSQGNFIGTGVCHYQAHSYTGDKVLGWLRPIKTVLTDSQKLQKIRDIYHQAISNDEKVNQTIPYLA